MKGWAAVPTNSVVIALGLGLTRSARVTGSAMAGVMAGVVLAGVCFLLLLAWRRGSLRRSRPRASNRSTATPDLFMAAPIMSPADIQADEKLEPQDSVSYWERASYLDCLASRSRHGLDQRAPITWRSVLVPTSARHAAPSPVMSAVAAGIGIVTTKFAVRPLPVRN